MNKRIILLFVLLLVPLSLIFLKNNPTASRIVSETDFSEDNLNSFQTEAPDVSIEALRSEEYPGSELVIEETLPPGINYDRFIASYTSEGLKIYALLTVPKADAPKDGFPAIVFNHGYIPPREYKTTERYIGYTDVFSRNGYVLLRPDYRGHGNSEGEAVGAYGSNAYTIDVLNAFSSLKMHEKVNPERIGMWGHSLGGFITLRSMVAVPDIKAGVIWAGVVGSYPDLINNWRRGVTGTPPALPSGARRWRQVLQEEFGTPEENPKFWNSISANSYLSDISGPLQLHHGTADVSVPILFSRNLEKQMRTAEKEIELYEYPGDDHNLSLNFSLAAQRSVEFFDRYLK